MIESYGNALIRYKKLILVVLSMLTIVAGIGLLNSSITADFRVYFDPEHEDTKVFENIEEAFGSLDLLYIAVVPHHSDTVYSKEYLSMLDSFANELSYVPHNVRVESLTNHQRAISTEDGLSIDPLFDGARYDDASAIPDQVLTEIEEYVQSNQLLTNLMVSDQGDVGAVKVSFKFSSDINERTQQMHESVLFVESLIERYEGLHQGISFHMIGSLILNHQIGRSIVQDLLTCVPISYVLVTFLLYFLLARQSIFLVFTVITVADIIVLGITGWLDIILTPMLAFVPSTIMVIGIADCIHLLTNYYNNLCDGQTQKQALIESLKKNFRAITITSVTTMAGFLCLSFSPSPVYRQLGYLMAGGTFAAYVLSVTLLPIMLTYCKIPKQLHRPRVIGLMTWLSQSMAQHHKKYLVGCFVVIVAMSAPIYKNQLNDNWHNYFEPSVKLRQDTDIINDRISGLHTIEYLMHADNGTYIYDKAHLEFLDQLRQWYVSQPGVTYVGSVSEILKALNQSFQDGSAEAYQLPESGNLASNYLMVYDMSVPNGLALSNILDSDRTTTKFTVIMEKTYSKSVLELVARAEAWIKANRPESMVVEPATGGDVIFSKLSEENTESMFWGTLLAFAVISVLIGAITRSGFYGMISLLTNTLPALAAFGVWGLMVAEIGMATSTVVCIAIGLIVDDTVHFLVQYRHARQVLGKDAVGAVQYAYMTSGLAIITTTFILTAGFIALTFSTFSATATTGMLLSITIVTALFVDLFFVPALLIMLDKKTLVGEVTHAGGHHPHAMPLEGGNLATYR